VEVINDLMFGE